MFLNLVRDARHFIDEGFVPSQKRESCMIRQGVCIKNNGAVVSSHGSSLWKPS